MPNNVFKIEYFRVLQDTQLLLDEKFSPVSVITNVYSCTRHLFRYILIESKKTKGKKRKKGKLNSLSYHHQEIGENR